MFKNSVFKASVNTKEWFKATMVRCVRTFASTFVALIPSTAVTLGSVDWMTILSGSALATVIIFATCVAGIPETKSSEEV